MVTKKQELLWLVFNNNLLIQFGGNLAGNINLPITYTSHYSICCCHNDQSFAGCSNVWILGGSKTLSSFSLVGGYATKGGGTAGNYEVSWITVGY